MRAGMPQETLTVSVLPDPHYSDPHSEPGSPSARVPECPPECPNDTNARVPERHECPE